MNKYENGRWRIGVSRNGSGSDAEYYDPSQLVIADSDPYETNRKEIDDILARHDLNERAVMDFSDNTVSDPEWVGSKKPDDHDYFAMFSREGDLILKAAFDDVIAMDLPVEDVWFAMRVKMGDLTSIGYDEVWDTAVTDLLYTKLKEIPKYRNLKGNASNREIELEKFRMYTPAGAHAVEKIMKDIIDNHKLGYDKVRDHVKQRLEKLKSKYPEAGDEAVYNNLISLLAREGGRLQKVPVDYNTERLFQMKGFDEDE